MNQRITELLDAIERYAEHGSVPKAEWVSELRELIFGQNAAAANGATDHQI